MRHYIKDYVNGENSRGGVNKFVIIYGGVMKL